MKNKEMMREFQFVNQRVLNYPCERVFEAWTDPDHLAAWWGPKGFRNTFETFEFKTGGQWKFVMRGPDGKDYPNLSVFKEIVPGERIVFDHISLPKFEVEAVFEKAGEGTKLTFRMKVSDEVTYNALMRIVPEKNEENLDRLEAELEKMKRSRK